jgi:hypothetical protein
LEEFEWQKSVVLGWFQDRSPMNFEIRKLTVKLGNSFVRLTAAERRKVMRAIKQFTFGKASSASERDIWSKDEAKTCYLLLKPISQKMANDFRSWASEYRETEHQFRLAFRSRIAELVRRKRSEER